MKELSLSTIARAMEGTLLAGDGVHTVDALRSDSRNMRPGALFVPYRGERFDGHDYINAALDAGACGALCERAPETLREGKAYILVDDTRLAMKRLAAWYRAQFSLPVVQITGSTGKTTAKEMVWAVLSQRYPTLKTAESFNGDIGTPQTLLELSDAHRAAVIESGMDHPGDIRYLGEMVKPSIACIVNVGVAHIEYLGSRENILKAKCEIFEHLAPDGVAILNGDDDMLARVKNLPQRIVRFGKSEGCDVRVTDWEADGLCGARCTVLTARGTYHLETSAPGEHMVYPMALSVAVGEELGLRAEEITRGVAAYAPVGGRMNVKHLPDGRVLLDDCYNANPQSMSAALRVLASARGARRIAVLGNMGELGVYAPQAHRDMGRLTGELGVDTLFAIGPYGEAMAQEARAAGCGDVHAYLTKEEAYDAIGDAFVPDAVLLLKASHYSGRFEHIAAYLEKRLNEKS